MDTTTNPSHDKNLVNAARRFVDRALAFRDEGDWEGFVVHAYTAIELLAKAVLAQINLLLIADGQKGSTNVRISVERPPKKEFQRQSAL